MKMISMARKTTNCYSCNSKSENLIKYSIDNEKDYWFCEECYYLMTDDDFNILNIKYYILKIMNMTRVGKTIDERINNFIKNMDKTCLLFSLKSRQEEMKRYLASKTFKNNYAKWGYLQKMIETLYEKEYKRQQEVEKAQTDFDIPIPLVKSVIKRVRDISKYLN